MIRHITLGVASAAALAIAVPAANAADLPAYEPAPAVVAPVPSFSWSGPYVGAQVGHGWTRASNMNQNGWMLGAYAGYNYQFDNSPVVVGIETDFNWADQDGRKGQRGGTTRTKSDWNGATRARIGYAADRVLVYGAAGLAYADRELKRSPGGKDEKTATGWTVGGGVDVALTDNVVARGEYRYTDYGKDRFSLPNSSLKSSATEHRVMGGLAVKFDSPF